MHLIQKSGFFAALLAVCLSAAGAVDQYYRYENAEGTMVINSSLPPELASKGGYDIIDDKGHLIKSVEAFGSEEERRQQREEENRKKSEAEAQRKYDVSLLKRYSFVSDIEAEQKRQVAQLQTRVSILQGNLRGFRADLEKAYEEAAARERQNKPVGDQLEKRIGHLEERIKATEKLLEAQDEKIAQTRENYARAIERFKELENRRQRVSPQPAK